jgi:AraC-like DNA-binding protein
VSLTKHPSLSDVTFNSTDEALQALRDRTTRVTRITPSGGPFRMRMRSLGFRGIRLTQTWESSAAFESNGQPVPMIFFPMSRATSIRTATGEKTCSGQTIGCFTVAEPAVFHSAKGYSEITLRFDTDLLTRYLALLEVPLSLTEVLTRAALRSDVAGLAPLRRMASELLEDADVSGSEEFRTQFDRVQEEMLALRAASVLSKVVRPIRDQVSCHRGLRRAIEFIHLRFRDELLIDEVAQAAGISIRLLQSLFRHQLDCTPGDYIRRLRLDDAHRRLSQRLAASVTEAALESGFSHLGEFSAAYRRRYGEKPSETLRHA